MEEFSVNPNLEEDKKKRRSWPIVTIILVVIILIILIILYYFAVNLFRIGSGLTPGERQKMIEETSSSGESFLQGEEAERVNKDVTSEGGSNLIEGERQNVLKSLTSGS